MAAMSATDTLVIMRRRYGGNGRSQQTTAK